jgi:DNA-binding NtrC family response regulator
VLQNKLRTLILDDLQEKGPPLNEILNSKCYCANSLTYLENAADIIRKEKPDLLILDLNFSEASIIRILQKVREDKPSLPIFICSDSVTRQFKNQAAQLRVSGFFRKADVVRRPRVWVKQMLDQIKKNVAPRRVSVNNEGRGARHPSDLSKKRKKGGERRWQLKRTLALPA